jgi:hypothetical protein
VPTDLSEVAFDVFTLDGTGARVPVSAGARQYSVSDVAVVRRIARDGSVFWEKWLPLGDSGFGIGVFLDEAPIREHLGLFVVRPSGRDPFSWENFVAEQGTVFVDDRGGQLEAAFDAGPGPDHLKSLAFLADTALRYKDDVMTDERFTHEVVVKKGSVFRVR